MDTNLTLKLKSDVIERAKLYARENGTSLSVLVENYFVSIAPKRGKKYLSEELVGCLKGMKQFGDEDVKRMRIKNK